MQLFNKIKQPLNPKSLSIFLIISLITIPLFSLYSFKAEQVIAQDAESVGCPETNTDPITVVVDTMPAPIDLTTSFISGPIVTGATCNGSCLAEINDIPAKNAVYLAGNPNIKAPTRCSGIRITPADFKTYGIVKPPIPVPIVISIKWTYLPEGCADVSCGVSTTTFYSTVGELPDDPDISSSSSGGISSPGEDDLEECSDPFETTPIDILSSPNTDEYIIVSGPFAGTKITTLADDPEVTSSTNPNIGASGEITMSDDKSCFKGDLFGHSKTKGCGWEVLPIPKKSVEGKHLVHILCDLIINEEKNINLLQGARELDGFELEDIEAATDCYFNNTGLVTKELQDLFTDLLDSDARRELNQALRLLKSIERLDKKANEALKDKKQTANSAIRNSLRFLNGAFKLKRNLVKVLGGKPGLLDLDLSLFDD